MEFFSAAEFRYILLVRRPYLNTHTIRVRRSGARNWRGTVLDLHEEALAIVDSLSYIQRAR